MKFLTLALIPSRDVRAGSYDRGGLRSTKHSTITSLLCAVTKKNDERSRAWVGEKLPAGQGWSPLGTPEIEALLLYLEGQRELGCIPVTWDGLRETFALLMKFCEGVSRPACEGLALRHIDIAFQLFCSRGFIISLKSILQSMNIEDQTHGRRTAFARSIWDKGEEAQRELLKVAREIAGTIAQLYATILETNNLTWLTKDGAEAYWTPETAYDLTSKGDRLLTVTEALELEDPDTSWMSVPFKKDRGSFLVGLQPATTEEPKTGAIARVDDLPPTDEEDMDQPESPLPDNYVLLDLSDPIARFAARNYALLIRNTQSTIAKELLARIKTFER